jgi:hypothetical protein
MWKGYEEALGRYGLTSCEVWTERGFGDSCAATIAADLRAAGIAKIRSYEQLAANDALPPWLFDEAVQLSHRSSLLRKDPEHYGPLFPSDTPRDLYYVWPVRSPAVIERELRKEENARRRAQQTAAMLVQEEMERGRNKRSGAGQERLEDTAREGEAGGRAVARRGSRVAQGFCEDCENSAETMRHNPSRSFGVSPVTQTPCSERGSVQALTLVGRAGSRNRSRGSGRLLRADLSLSWCPD